MENKKRNLFDDDSDEGEYKPSGGGQQDASDEMYKPQAAETETLPPTTQDYTNDDYMPQYDAYDAPKNDEYVPSTDDYVPPVENEYVPQTDEHDYVPPVQEYVPQADEYVPAKEPDYIPATKEEEYVPTPVEAPKIETPIVEAPKVETPVAEVKVEAIAETIPSLPEKKTPKAQAEAAAPTEAELKLKEEADIAKKKLIDEIN